MKTIYLLVKTHNKTGLKYLCQTTRSDYDKYPGSGTYWKKHLKKHGLEHTTEVIKECANREEMIYWGQHYSNLWNIVESDKWANLKPEEGNGNTETWMKELWSREDFRIKKFNSFAKTSATEEYKQKQSLAGKKVWANPEYRKNRPDQSGTNNPNYDSTPYTFISEEGQMFIGTKWEFSQQYKLRTKAVRHLVKGDVKFHKGWKVVKEDITNRG